MHRAKTLVACIWHTYFINSNILQRFLISLPLLFHFIPFFFFLSILFPSFLIIFIRLIRKHVSHLVSYPSALFIYMYDYVTILFFYFSNKYNEGARINIGFTIPLFFLSFYFFFCKDCFGSCLAVLRWGDVS